MAKWSLVSEVINKLSSVELIQLSSLPWQSEAPWVRDYVMWALHEPLKVGWFSSVCWGEICWEHGCRGTVWSHSSDLSWPLSNLNVVQFKRVLYANHARSRFKIFNYSLTFCKYFLCSVYNSCQATSAISIRLKQLSLIYEICHYKNGSKMCWEFW